jgi:hypothetical protein
LQFGKRLLGRLPVGHDLREGCQVIFERLRAEAAAFTTKDGKDPSTTALVARITRSRYRLWYFLNMRQLATA